MKSALHSDGVGDISADYLGSSELTLFFSEFNLSEITFPYAVSAESSTYSVRIFTPGKELPFAGHPTLGTCFA